MFDTSHHVKGKAAASYEAVLSRTAVITRLCNAFSIAGGFDCSAGGELWKACSLPLSAQWRNLSFPSYPAASAVDASGPAATVSHGAGSDGARSCAVKAIAR